MFVRKLFPIQKNYSGLFHFFRQVTDVRNEMLFTITAEKQYNHTVICGKYSPSDKYSLVDGDDKIAFANNENEKEKAYFIVNFMKNSFQMTGISFHTMCCPAVIIEISAGNNLNDIHSLGNITNITENEIQIKQFLTYTSYSTYKISMPDGNSCPGLSYRFQLSEIEFFGILNPMNIKCSYQFKMNIQIFICYIFVFL